jgi:transposase-like protein
MDDASLDAMHQDRHPAGAYRRIEPITGTARRRRSTVEEKAAIVAETTRPGVNVAEVARRFGVDRGLLQTWRRKAIGERSVFFPLRVDGVIAATDNNMERANPLRSMAVEADASTRPGTLEIKCSAIRARSSGPVDATVLRLVMTHIGRHA